jgi:lysophospholipase L1-like esterase
MPEHYPALIFSFLKLAEARYCWSMLTNQFSSGSSKLSRRNFVKTAGLTLGVGAAGLGNLCSGANKVTGEAWPPVSRDLVTKGDTILFQGDSITDAGRSREGAATPNDQAALGSGYAWLAAAELLVDWPASDAKIYNRGISGNKVFQLADRWQTDCLDLKPNLLSILIGVNDFWHTLNGSYKGTVEVYERDYRALLERTRKALPKVKLVICEPFVLRCGAVNEKWFPAFDSYRVAARRVAQAHNALFIPFQAMFDEAIKYAPPSHWAGDGVHPTAAGASMMAHAWLRAAAGKR